MKVNGLKECPKCGKPAWREASSNFFKCPNGHRTGNKYGSKRSNSIEVQNSDLIKRFGSFDSNVEKQYFQEHLGWLEKIGKVTKLRHHTVIDIVPGMTYETDWDYVDENGVYRVVDVKGVMGERFKVICDLWPIFGMAPLDIVKRGQRGWITKTIQAGKWDAKREPNGQWIWRKVA